MTAAFIYSPQTDIIVRLKVICYTDRRKQRMKIDGLANLMKNTGIRR